MEFPAPSPPRGRPEPRGDVSTLRGLDHGQDAKAEWPHRETTRPGPRSGGGPSDRSQPIRPKSTVPLFGREHRSGSGRNPGAFPGRLNAGCQNDGQWGERWVGAPHPSGVDPVPGGEPHVHDHATVPHDRIEPATSHEALAVAVHESRVTSVQKDSRSNMGHAVVRSNWMGATTAPGRRRAVQPSPFLGEALRLRGSESWHPFQPPPSPRCCREVDELPSEGTSDASLQIASVQSDRSRLIFRRRNQPCRIRGNGE